MKIPERKNVYCDNILEEAPVTGPLEGEVGDEEIRFVLATPVLEEDF